MNKKFDMAESFWKGGGGSYLTNRGLYYWYFGPGGT